MRHALFVLSALAGLLAGPVAARGEHLLRFRGEEGETFTYTTKLDLELSGPGFSMTLKYRSILGMDMTSMRPTGCL